MKFTIPLITTLLSLLPVLISGQDDSLACRNCMADVDDSDPRIIYSPATNWIHQILGSDMLYYNTTNSFARTVGSKATFTFTGVGIEYWTLQPFYDITIQIDGETLSSGNGTDLSTSTIIVFSRAFNTSGEHTITLTATAAGTPYLSSVSLDRFRIDNGSVTSSAKVSSTSGVASSSATKSSASRLHISTQTGMAIAGLMMSLLLVCAL